MSMTVAELVRMTRDSNAGIVEITMKDANDTPTDFIMCVVGAKEIGEIRAAVNVVTEAWAKDEGE